jgi:hypothetical protein
MDRTEQMRADPAEVEEMRIEHELDRQAEAAQAAGKDQHRYNPYDHRPNYATYWVPGGKQPANEQPPG